MLVHFNANQINGKSLVQLFMFSVSTQCTIHTWDGNALSPSLFDKMFFEQKYWLFHRFSINNSIDLMHSQYFIDRFGAIFCRFLMEKNMCFDGIPVKTNRLSWHRNCLSVCAEFQCNCHTTCVNICHEQFANEIIFCDLPSLICDV